MTRSNLGVNVTGTSLHVLDVTGIEGRGACSTFQRAVIRPAPNVGGGELERVGISSSLPVADHQTTTTTKENTR